MSWVARGARLRVLIHGIFFFTNINPDRNLIFARKLRSLSHSEP
jgi:hypothetical protein